ncbi:MAG: hypothetical protein HZB53_00500 [Chloroflexi bacterium]|nr:hypothetical protein [Chloroflexota bacterium]
MRLFVERATFAQPRFALTTANATAITQICRRLDGVPLAIELAAARVKALSPEQIVARLDDRFRLLTGGSRTTLPRQQTLRAAIDWSYSLLTEPEKTLLRRLSVFAGGWTLDAAEAVCANNSFDQADILDLLEHLVDKSLVTTDLAEDAARYRMLETVRQYTRERLLDSGEAGVTHGAHKACFLEFARTAEPRLETSEQVVWIQRCEEELDNMRAAIDWAMDRRDAESALQILNATSQFSFPRNHSAEWRLRTQQALALGSADLSLASHARALGRLTVIEYLVGDLNVAETLGRRGLEIAEQSNDTWVQL